MCISFPCMHTNFSFFPGEESKEDLFIRNHCAGNTLLRYINLFSKFQYTNCFLCNQPLVISKFRYFANVLWEIQN